MRPPHVHFAVFAPEAEPFITQMYFAGDPLNARDRLLNGVGDPSARARLVVALENPPPDLEPGYRRRLPLAYRRCSGTRLRFKTLSRAINTLNTKCALCDGSVTIS